MSLSMCLHQSVTFRYWIQILVNSMTTKWTSSFVLIQECWVMSYQDIYLGSWKQSEVRYECALSWLYSNMLLETYTSVCWIPVGSSSEIVTNLTALTGSIIIRARWTLPLYTSAVQNRSEDEWTEPSSRRCSLITSVRFFPWQLERTVTWKVNSFHSSRQSHYVELGV